MPSHDDRRAPEPEAKPVRLHRARVEDLDCVCDLVDSQLRGDAYIPRSQMTQILRRHTTAVWMIEFEGELVGVAITYEKTMLYNIVVAPWARGKGVAKSVLNQLQVRAVRCKTNMKAGDPTPFYEANGFRVHERDEARPHIAVMTRELDVPAESIANTGEGTDMVLSLLKRLVLGEVIPTKKGTHQVSKKKEDVQQQQKLEEKHNATDELGKMSVEVPLEQWEAIRADAQKYRERAEKQRGYQSKRYAKKQKMRRGSPEQSALEVNVKTD